VRSATGTDGTPGQPSEAGMSEDTEAGHQALLQRGVPANRIILLGHSLGSGPAVLLATRHEAAALVLVRRVYLPAGCRRLPASLSAGANGDQDSVQFACSNRRCSHADRDCAQPRRQGHSLFRGGRIFRGGTRAQALHCHAGTAQTMTRRSANQSPSGFCSDASLWRSVIQR
jgi:hypothetical protein